MKEKISKILRIPGLWGFVYLFTWLAPNPFVGLMMLLALISRYGIWVEDTK